MFRRKKKEQRPDFEIAEMIAHSENQKQDSQKELEEAKEFETVLRNIRQENHIVLNLREVFGGR